MKNVNDMIRERTSVHGELTENARATWNIMRSLQAERNWPTLPDHMKHALYMIAHKMARIMAGDSMEQDHWADISGYSMAVQNRLAHPVTPYDASGVYGALAVAWGVTYEEARSKFIEMSRVAQERQSIRAEQRVEKAISEAQQEMMKDFAVESETSENELAAEVQKQLEEEAGREK